jgi:hypothetical protein
LIHDPLGKLVWIAFADGPETIMPQPECQWETVNIQTDPLPKLEFVVAQEDCW